MPILLLGFSCHLTPKNRFADSINKADKLQITYTSGGYRNTTIPFTQEEKKMFQEVLDDKAVHCVCNASGRLRFYKDNNVILIADYTIGEKGQKPGEGCQFLFADTWDEDCFRLTYQAGMFLNLYR